MKQIKSIQEQISELDTVEYKSLLYQFEGEIKGSGLHPNTILSSVSDVKDLFLFMENNLMIKSLARISYADTEEYLDYLKVKPSERTKGKENTIITASTYNHCLCSIKRFNRFLLANKRKSIAGNFKQIKADHEIMDVLSMQEIQELFQIAERFSDSKKTLKYLAILSIGFGAGLRAGEITNVDIKDVNLNTAQIHVRKVKNRKARVVPIADCFLLHIKRYLQFVREEIDTSETALLLNREEMRISDQSLRYCLRELISLSGISKTVGLHTLRRSYGTNLYLNGFALSQIQQLMGHSVQDSTEIYIILSKQIEAQQTLKVA